MPQHKYLSIYDKGLVLDGSTQPLTGQLQRQSNDTRPKVLLSGKQQSKGHNGGSLLYVWEAGEHEVVIKDFGVADSYSRYTGFGIYKSNAVSVFGGYYCNNGHHGIQISHSSNTQIGLDEAGANPVIISGNSRTGIFVFEDSVDIKILNVFAGVDWTGMVAMPNVLRGIEVSGTSGAKKITIGSDTPGVLTIISGNFNDGIYLAGVSQAYIFGVFVGVGKDGTTSLGNALNGISVQPVAQLMSHVGDEGRTTIGKKGTLTVISGNGYNGIFSATKNMHIIGNTFVGVCSDGATACPNLGTAGVYIGTARANIGPGVVASGNKGRGIYITAEDVNVNGVYVGVSQDGATAVPNELDGIFVTESAMFSIRISGGVISGNGGSGIFTEGANMQLLSSTIGLSADGKTSLPNGHYGIEIGTFGTNVGIGPLEYQCPAGTFVYTYGSHCCLVNVDKEGDPLVYDSPTCKNDNYISCPGGASDHQCVDAGSDGTSVIVSGNVLGGIKSAGQSLWICNALVGLSADGLNFVPNGGNGVEILESGKGSRIGSMVDGSCTAAVAGNRGHGLVIYAPDVEVNRVSIGANPVGNALQIIGGTFGNKGVGILVQESASGAGIIACTVSGSGGDGILLHGPRATVNQNTIGQGISRGTLTAGNHGSGLRIKATSTGTSVGGAPSKNTKFEKLVGCLQITVVGFGKYDGVYTETQGRTFSGVSTYTSPDGRFEFYRCQSGIYMISAFGFSLEDPTHCRGYIRNGAGIKNNVDLGTASWSTWGGSSWETIERASITADCTAPQGNFIAANFFQGIRDDTTSTDNVTISDTNTIVTNLITNGGSVSPNGRGLDACKLCTCTSTTVDCRPAVGNPDRDFGPSFPTNLPAATTELYMSNVGLLHVDWTEIAKISETLKVLDLAQNHNVDPLPETGHFDKNVFPALEVISLSGTDLTRLTADTFANLNGDLIDTLDLSAPSKQPAASNIPLNLKGFSKPLAAILWYSNSCPPGYYATSGSPAQPVRLSFDHLMTIVVSDSFSSHFFLKLLLSLMSCRMECFLNFTQIDLLCYVWI